MLTSGEQIQLPNKVEPFHFQVQVVILEALEPEILRLAAPVGAFLDGLVERSAIRA
jgi:hypothetical protein